MLNTATSSRLMRFPKSDKATGIKLMLKNTPAFLGHLLRIEDGSLIIGAENAIRVKNPSSSVAAT